MKTSVKNDTGSRILSACLAWRFSRSQFIRLDDTLKLSHFQQWLVPFVKQLHELLISISFIVFFFSFVLVCVKSWIFFISYSGYWFCRFKIWVDTSEIKMRKCFLHITYKASWRLGKTLHSHCLCLPLR